ncbi:MAG: DUF4097 domain-containing protein [Acidobacteriota bacterium]|nr:DUF4097 domain-containing protein [Acidobacteriota bacterium]
MILNQTTVFPQTAKSIPRTSEESAGYRQDGFAREKVALSRGPGLAPAGPVGDAEKAVAVNKNVYVSFCVTNAPVKINGWKRSEVRAFVKGRNDIGFKIRERNSKDKKPAWVEIVAGAGQETGRKIDSCLTGNSIELDVPYGASVTINGESGQTSVVIDSIKKAKVDISSGDISMSNIAWGIQAFTDVGGVSVRNSSGSMNMKTTAGNIVAFETEANEIGDSFKAKTHSGAITMQSIGQKDVEASSISGSINYIGNMKPSGTYSFSTTDGLITLALPSSASFKLNAAFGGSFSSSLPLQNITKEANRSAVYLSGDVGKSNGTSVVIRSYSGTIRILRSDRLDTPNWFR